MREVRVFCGGVYAGTLTEHSRNEYVFRYDDGYYHNQSLPAISLTLPKTKQEYFSNNLFPFFTNLLPEGANRKVFCNLFKIDEKDFFGMLIATEKMDIIGDIGIKSVNV